MEIALLRHGKPEVASDVRIPAFQFSEWISHYDASGIAESSMPSKASLEYAQTCGIVVSSSLIRSIESAESLSADNYLQSDKLFCEAGMPYAQWNTLKLAPTYWAAFFRMMWYFGFAGDTESFADARKRALLAANRLVRLAEVHQSVLLTGHGIFNRLIARELKNLGWSGPKSPGSKYWDFGIYSKAS